MINTIVSKYIIPVIVGSVVISGLILFIKCKIHHTRPNLEQHFLRGVIIFGFILLFFIPFLLPRPLNVGSTRSTVSMSLVKKRYKIELEADTQYEIQVQTTDFWGIDFAIRIATNPFMFDAVEVDSISETGETLRFTPEQGGRYYIQIINSGRSGHGFFDLSVSENTSGTETENDPYFNYFYLILLFLPLVLNVLVSFAFYQTKDTNGDKSSIFKGKYGSKAETREYTPADPYTDHTQWDKASFTNSYNQGSLKKQKQRLMGMIKVEKEVDLKDAVQFLNLGEGEIRGLIYELAGRDDIRGHFEGDVFKIDDGVDHFISALDNEFEGWQEKEAAKSSKI